jgi:polar amino acid transport system substrate-binding protein
MKDGMPMCMRWARFKSRLGPLVYLQYASTILVVAVLLFAPTTAVFAQAHLRVALKNDTPFYQFTDASGFTSGLHVDIMNAIAKENDLILEYVPMEKLWDCIDALDRGEVDAVLGVPSSESGDYLGSMETTTADISILARHSFLPTWDENTFSSYTAVLEYNTTNISLISNMGASTYVVTGSQMDLLQTHLAGYGDFMICDLSCMNHLLKLQNLQDQFTVVKHSIGTVGYVTAVRRGNVTLLRLINDGLMRLRLSGEYDKIQARWIDEETGIREQLARIIRISFILATFTGFGILAFVYTSTRIKNMLKKEVKEKTRELNRRISQLQAESELRTRIIERSPNGIILFDRENTVTLINSSASRMAGFPERTTGRSIMELPLFGEILGSHTVGGFAGEHQIIDRRYVVPMANGLRKVYQYSILPIQEGSVCTSALITVRDITADEEKKLASMEKSKNKTLNLMMAGIAHEIKNPLTGIRNFAMLIKTKREDKQFLDHFSVLVPQEVDRISRLIESMMQYARPPKGNPEKMDLSLVANECAYMTKATIKSKRIKVETILPEGLYIEADRDQINQVIINIILNSIASMEKKGHRLSGNEPLKLSVSSRVLEDQVILDIQDEGEGMSEQTLRLCTEPFYTSRSTGTGLGLALSKQLIQENNGTLVIESRENAGTRMSIQFRRYGA